MPLRIGLQSIRWLWEKSGERAALCLGERRRRRGGVSPLPVINAGRSATGHRVAVTG